MRKEMSKLIERKLEQANEASEEKSREIINLAIQRYAAEQTCESQRLDGGYSQR